MTTLPFEIGEIINPEDWGIRLQITSVVPLEAVIIKSEPTSGSRAWAERFFPVGRVLRFTPARPDVVASWRIDTDDSATPWYLLGVYEGRKRFEHYR